MVSYNNHHYNGPDIDKLRVKRTDSWRSQEAKSSSAHDASCQHDHHLLCSVRSIFILSMVQSRGQSSIWPYDCHGTMDKHPRAFLMTTNKLRTQSYLDVWITGAIFDQTCYHLEIDLTCPRCCYCTSLSFYDKTTASM